MGTETEPPERPGDEVVTGEPEAPELGAGEGFAGERPFEVVGASYRGPLPPPQMLDDYNAVLPGLAERIVSMAERDQAHSHSMARRSSMLRFTGQAAALLIAVAGLVTGGLLIDAGNGIEGLATLLTALAPIVGAFLYRQIKGADNGS